MEWEITQFFRPKSHPECFLFDSSRPDCDEMYWRSYVDFLVLCLKQKWKIPSYENPLVKYILENQSSSEGQIARNPVQVEIVRDSEVISLVFSAAAALQILTDYCTETLVKTSKASEIAHFILIAMLQVEMCWPIFRRLDSKPFLVEELMHEGPIKAYTIRRFTQWKLYANQRSSESPPAKRQKSSSCDDGHIPISIAEALQCTIDANTKASAIAFLKRASKFDYHKASVEHYPMEMFSVDQIAAMFRGRGVVVPEVLQVPTSHQVVYHLRENAAEWKVRVTMKWLEMEYHRITNVVADYTILTLGQHVFIVTTPAQMTSFQIILDYAKIEFDKGALSLPATTLHLRNLTFEYMQCSPSSMMELSLYGWMRSLAYTIGGRKLARRVIIPTSRRFDAYASFTGFLEHWTKCEDEDEFLELIDILIVFLDMDTEHVITRKGLEYLREAFQITAPHFNDNNDLLTVVSRLFRFRDAEVFSLSKLGRFESSSKVMDWADIYKSVLYILPLPPKLVKNILREISLNSETKGLAEVQQVRKLGKNLPKYKFPVFLQSIDSQSNYLRTQKELAKLNVHNIAERESIEYENFFNVSQITNSFVFNETRNFFDDRKELKQYHKTALALESVISRIKRDCERRVRNSYYTPKLTKEYKERLAMNFDFSFLADPAKNCRIPILVENERVLYFEQSLVLFEFASPGELDLESLNFVSRTPWTS